VLRELDESFTNVYSTVVSVQNLRPLWDRRVLSVVIAVVTTVLALALKIKDYENFLVLLGSVFVPMFAVLVADFFIVSKGRWDLSASARSRWVMIVPWAAGFAVYQLINPGYVSWWVAAWTWIARLIGFTPASWMSASVLSFCVAAAMTLVMGLLPLPGRRRQQRAGTQQADGQPAR